MNPRWIFYGTHRIQKVYLGSRLIFRSQVRRPGVSANEEAFLWDDRLLLAAAKACGIPCEEITIPYALAQSAEGSPAAVRSLMGVKEDAHLRVGKVLLSDSEQIRMQQEAKPEALPGAVLKAKGTGTVRSTGVGESAHLQSQKLLRGAVLPAEMGFMQRLLDDTAAPQKAISKVQGAYKGKAYAQRLMQPACDSGRYRHMAAGRSGTGRPASASEAAHTGHKGKLYGQRLLKPASGRAKEWAVGKIMVGLAKPEKADSLERLSSRVYGRSDAAKWAAGRAALKLSSNAKGRSDISKRVIGDAVQKLSAQASPRAAPPEIMNSTGIAGIHVRVMPEVLDDNTGTMTEGFVSGAGAALLTKSIVPMAAAVGANARYADTMGKQSTGSVWEAPVQTGKKLKIVSVYECKQEGRKLTIR